MADQVPAQDDLTRRQAEHEFDQQARAETAAGMGVPVEAVEKWVESWDTPHETPIPKAGKIR